MNESYLFPKGYESFEKVKAVFEANLPEGCSIEVSKAGEAKGFVAKVMEKAHTVSTQGFSSKAKTLGEINIKKNSYVGVSIVCTSCDGEKNDAMAVMDYVPSPIIRFLMSKVLGFVTNLIFPAIYGSPSKLVAEVNKIIMANFEANRLDTSVLGAIKGLGKGLGTVESSVKE
jgi:hypothetical protein